MKKEMMGMCQAMAELVGPGPKEGTEILEQILRHDQSHFSSFMRTSPDGQLWAVAGVRWATSGFPSVVIGAKYAAALMATDVPAELADGVRAPWDGWIIEVPSNLLFSTTHDGKQDEIRRILITQEPHKFGYYGWGWVSLSDSGLSLFRFGLPGKHLASADLGVEPNQSVMFPIDIDSQDERAAALIGRLILGVCLAMQEPKNFRITGGSSSKKKRRTKGAPDLVGRTYVLGRPITIDCRPAVAAYLGGRRHAPPSVQHVVRGHWKNQPHGAARAQRKTLWIEPYWRGDEDAPILTRDHTLGKTKEAT